MPLSRRKFISQSSALYAALSTIKYRAMASAAQQQGLKDIFKDDFLIGTAISGKLMRASKPDYLALLTREFNAITMENDMKWENVHPEVGRWDWEVPDKYAEFGRSNNILLTGHVLVWHSQVPDWVFLDSEGNKLGKKALLDRMENHIHTLAGRYKGKMYSWDVVNESIDEGKGWRQSHWFKIIGPEFMDRAFHMAQDADPAALLIYNDYNMFNPGKRKHVVKFIREFKKKGVPIHGVGMQGHLGLTRPNLKEFEKSILAYAELGLKVHITELDVDVLPSRQDYLGAEITTKFEYAKSLNPYTEGLPAAIEKQLSERYAEIFRLFLKHRDKIARVTFWGTSDGESWKNNFPVAGRTNYPLLFDRNYHHKPAYNAVVKLKK